MLHSPAGAWGGEEMTDTTLLSAADWLRRYSATDPDVRMAVQLTLASRGYTNIADMAGENPDQVIDLYEALRRMVDEVPL
jgi:hypothetical protein